MVATSYLIRPTTVFRDSYIEALREGLKARAAGSLDEEKIATIEADFPAHLASLDHNGQKPFREFGRVFCSVPANTFWLVDGRAFVGRVNIRARIDVETLAHFGGHVGYEIRPSMRRKGYGTRQFALALDICRGMGVGVARVSCSEDNIGSRKIIEANGGILLRRCEPAWFHPQPHLLFEVMLI